MPESVPLIPRHVLFGNPDRAAPSLSPDGRWIAFLAPLDGVLNVWLAEATDPAAARAITRDAGRGIQWYDWAQTSEHILYVQDRDGDENWHVYRVGVDGGDPTDLTPFESVHAQVQHVSYRFPEEILVGLNDRDPRWHDIYRVHILTGERTLVRQNDGYAGFVTDDGFQVRLGYTFGPSGDLTVHAFEDGREPRVLISVGPEDAMTTSVFGLDEAGRVAYASDSRGRNTGALVAIDLPTGASRVLAEDTRVDINDLMVHPTEKTPQAYATEWTRLEWHALDPSVAADLDVLGQVTDGDFHVISRTTDDRFWVVAFTMDDGPVRYYRYERATKRCQFLFTGRPALEGAALTRMRPVVIPARDGLDLVCYVSLPTDCPTDALGRPDSPLPMVLWVHGGPWGRDSWGYDPIHQWLANRGFAVMSINFRGSTGFGKTFVNAANHEWAGRMHDDLLDAVQWAIDEGIADPNRVAISGGSYGGYATLVGLTFTPETFACGVDIVGPSSLITLLENVPDYWAPMLPVLRDRVGDHTTEEGRALLLERSPLTRADRICRPLLIAQGANDPRVKQRESDQIVAAMRERSIPVTYLVYPDEGHGFARPENRISFFAAMEAFLVGQLGGRYEPVGGDLEGSSVQAVHGVEYVPGLAEAMAARQPAQDGGCSRCPNG